MSAHEPGVIRSPHSGRRTPSATIEIPRLQRMDIEDLLDLCETAGLDVPSQADRHEIITMFVRSQMKGGKTVNGAGVLEVLPDGFGFLRSGHYHYDPGPEDIYVSPSQIRRFGLAHGNTVEGQLRPPKGSEKYFALLKVEKVDGGDPEEHEHVVPFEDRRPLCPESVFTLTTEREDSEPDLLTTRTLDLLAPIGKGARGLILAPPKSGRTRLLQAVARGILTDSPKTHLIILLIDERPEEVTLMKEATQGASCEVIASTFDEPSSRHVHTAMMVIEKAKRLAEGGRDVVILLDSLTRLAHAHDVEEPASEKNLPCGLDPAALHETKRFFGAARRLEEGGSLTILATALTDTGCKMDETIVSELHGTGNVKIVLDSNLAQKRVFPAIDVHQTGVRHDERLMDENTLEATRTLRNAMQELSPLAAAEYLHEQLHASENNKDLLSNL